MEKREPFLIECIRQWPLQFPETDAETSLNTIKWGSNVAQVLQHAGHRCRRSQAKWWTTSVGICHLRAEPIIETDRDALIGCGCYFGGALAALGVIFNLREIQVGVGRDCTHSYIGVWTCWRCVITAGRREGERNETVGRVAGYCEVLAGVQGCRIKVHVVILPAFEPVVGVLDAALDRVFWGRGRAEGSITMRRSSLVRFGEKKNILTVRGAVERTGSWQHRLPLHRDCSRRYFGRCATRIWSLRSIEPLHLLYSANTHQPS